MKLIAQPFFSFLNSEKMKTTQTTMPIFGGFTSCMTKSSDPQDNNKVEQNPGNHLADANIQIADDKDTNSRRHDNGRTMFHILQAKIHPEPKTSAPQHLKSEQSENHRIQNDFDDTFIEKKSSADYGEEWLLDEWEKDRYRWQHDKSESEEVRLLTPPESSRKTSQSFYPYPEPEPLTDIHALEDPQDSHDTESQPIDCKISVDRFYITPKLTNKNRMSNNVKGVSSPGKKIAWASENIHAVLKIDAQTPAMNFEQKIRQHVDHARHRTEVDLFYQLMADKLKKRKEDREHAYQTNNPVLLKKLVKNSPYPHNPTQMKYIEIKRSTEQQKFVEENLNNPRYAAGFGPYQPPKSKLKKNT